MNTASFALYLLPTVWRRYKGPIIPTKEDHERYPSPIIFLQAVLTRPCRSYERLTQDDAVAPSSNRRSTSLTRLPPPPTTNPLLRADRPLGAHFEDTEPELVKLSVKETAWIAAWWSAVWFVANLSVTASLAWTSVASVTILSSTSGEWHSSSSSQRSADHLRILHHGLGTNVRRRSPHANQSVRRHSQVCDGHGHKVI